MRRMMCLAVFGVLLLMSASSQALEVGNHSFEEFVITNNGGNPEPPAGTQLEVWDGFDPEDGAKSGWWDSGASAWYAYSADVTSWHNDRAMTGQGGTKWGGTDGNLTVYLNDGYEVWNLTDNIVEAGKSYTLTIDARNDWTMEGSDPTLRMILYYDDGTVRTDIGHIDQVLTSSWDEYSLVLTPDAAAAGSQLGIALEVVTGNGNSWLHFDNVRLVPEPATVLFMGFSGLWMLRKRIYS